MPRPNESRSFTTDPTPERNVERETLAAWLRASEAFLKVGTARERAYHRLIIEALAETTRNLLGEG